VRSVSERRFLTVVHQQYDFSCGSAALATLLTYQYSQPLTEQAAFVGMWRDGDRAQIRRLGFSLLDMKRYLAARGLSSDGYQVNLEQIATARVPGIALIDVGGYKHFVTVKGIAEGALVLGDPSLGIRRMSFAQFKKMWNGVYFVITATNLQKSQVFNRETDWDLAPPGHITDDMRPAGLQALALTRPLPGDL
jgi:uncharacterized protein